MSVVLNEMAFSPISPDRPNGLFSHQLWDITTNVENNLMGGALWRTEGVVVSARAAVGPATPAMGCHVGVTSRTIGPECGIDEPILPVKVGPECWCFFGSEITIFRSFDRINGAAGLEEEIVASATRDALRALELRLEQDLADGNTPPYPDDDPDDDRCDNPAIFDFAAIPNWALDGSGMPIAMSIATALGRLEQLIVENGGGVIHVPYALANALLRSGLVRLSGTSMSTIIAGVPIIAGAGYPTSTIMGGGVSGPGESWIAATGPVAYLRSNVQVQGPVFDAHANEHMVRATVEGLAVWLPTVHATVLVADQGICG